MNTLLFALIRALRSHDWLRFLGFAYILSSLGQKKIKRCYTQDGK